MNAEMQVRIRSLLSPAIAVAQSLAIVCWIFVLAVTPDNQYGALEITLTLALLFTCVWQYCATHFRMWRLAGILSVVIVALCFSRADHLNSGMGINWALPIAVIIVLGSTLFVVYARDYLLVATLSWFILAPTKGIEPGSVVYIFIILFFLASTGLGILLNHTYTRTLRKVLSLETRFREQSLIDYLTNILNRRALMEALERHTKDSSIGYFLMLDIDNFKHINDRFGHDAGDDVLQTMAACLTHTEGSLAFGRMGGEEFGVILPVCSEQDAQGYVIRLLDTIRHSAGRCPFTCSAGLAEVNDHSSGSRLLKIADINLYQAKNGGKNRGFWKGQPIVGSAGNGLPIGSGLARDPVE